MISRLERGDLGALTLSSIGRVAAALGATLHVQLRWQGEQLERLMDASHAAIQENVAEMLTSLGWLVRVEVSFNHYGDRGRVDIVAFHATLLVLLIIEIKSALGDLQETLGRLDIKVRVGGDVARSCGWGSVASVVPVLVIGDLRSAREAVATHEALFGSFRSRGRSALAWLRHPAEPIPSGLLWFAPFPPRDGSIGARRRMRR